LIQNYAKSNATVLDFFAGSGTTAQSVLELNKDGGKRKVFLCTNNDKDDRNPNGIAKDTTIKRLKKINIPINVYEINQAEIYSGDNSLLNLIDEVDYDLPKFTSRIKKIE
jgi:adenine-specific DNA-methyltransferase